MPSDLSLIIDDLMAETRLLTTLVEGLSEDDWSTATPATGWSVRDQITHLAYFDLAAVQAATEPEMFAEQRTQVVRDVNGFTERVAGRYRHLAGRVALDWFRSSRAELGRVYNMLDPRSRIPWYGPDMGPASAVTARLMETWAHGHDVFDTFGQIHPIGRGLRHVAHLGVKTFANSFRVRGLKVPLTEVSVELAGGDGEMWRWGPDGGPEQVRGLAVDFCLVVTQRRHLSDTGLAVDGSVAQDWMGIAQAFAGPPGPGRAAVHYHQSRRG